MNTGSTEKSYARCGSTVPSLEVAERILRSALCGMTSCDVDPRRLNSNQTARALESPEDSGKRFSFSAGGRVVGASPVGSGGSAFRKRTHDIYT